MIMKKPLISIPKRFSYILMLFYILIEVLLIFVVNGMVMHLLMQKKRWNMIQNILKYYVFIEYLILIFF